MTLLLTGHVVTDAECLKVAARCFNMGVTLSHKIPSIRDIRSCAICTASSRDVIMSCRAREMIREVVFGLVHFSKPKFEILL